MIKRAPETDLSGMLRLIMQGEADRRRDQSASYAGYGRFALLNVLKLLGFGAGDRVLVPAYLCDVVLLPFAELGIEPVFYGIGDDFRVDWDRVPLPSGTRGFLSVNYFGFSTDYRGIAQFTGQNGLLWLNDNAHGFASCEGERSLEEFGDVSFTSFRKVLGSLNGARVRINNGRLAHLKEELDRLNTAAGAEPRSRYLAAATLRTLGLRLRALPDFSDPTGFQERDIKGYRLDELSCRLLARSDQSLIRQRRRALYRAIEEFLQAGAYRLLAPIPGLLKEGNSPLVLPVVAADRQAWLALLARSRSLGLDLHTWPSLPESVRQSNCMGAFDLWGRMLFLPLHQDLEAARYLPLLQRVLDAV